MFIINIGALLFLWVFIRSCQDMFLISNTTAYRISSYLYYVPLIFLPVMAIFLLEYMTRPKEYVDTHHRKRLYIPAFLLSILVLTNDIHQLVFRFPRKLHIDFATYERGIGYFVVIGWVGITSMIFLVGLLRTSYAPTTIVWWIVDGLILVGILYLVLCANGMLDHDPAVFISVDVICMLEVLLVSGVIPSNMGYREIFTSCMEQAYITDKEHQIRYRSGGGEEGGYTPTRQECIAAESGPVRIGNQILNSASIHGGNILWMTDVSALQSAIDRLQDTKERLAEEKDLIEAETELRKQNILMENRVETYERIYGGTRTQMDAIDALLQRENIGRRELSRICFLGVYVKRKGNLLVLKEEKTYIQGRELWLCLKESLNNLALLSVGIRSTQETQGDVRIDYALAAFDMYEELVEATLDQLEFLFLRLSIADEKIRLRLQMGLTKPLPQLGSICKQMNTQYKTGEEDGVPATITFEMEETDVNINIHIGNGERIL